MVKRYLLAVAFCVCTFTVAAGTVRRPAVSRTFFNPTLGQTVSLAFELSTSAAVTIRVIDRDGFAIRTLANAQELAAGAHAVTWDGRDEQNEIVADEAWSFRIDAGSDTYFPADAAAEMYDVADVIYNRRTALLHYTLPLPSRIHLQAGVTADAAKQTRVGAVMKTIVNRAPRAAGAVVEPWNGTDESGSIRIPDLPNFVVAVAATPLPENSVITVGSRGAPFVERAAKRDGASLFTHHVHSHAHHQGLSALEDATPPLHISAAGASRREGAWQISSRGPLRIECEVRGVSASAFVKQGGEVMLFVDGRLVGATPARGAKFTLDLGREHLHPGRSHIVAVNWATPNGPTAANSIRVHVDEPAAP